MVLPYNPNNGFNPLSLDEEKQLIIDSWNTQTGSTYTLDNIIGTDLDLIATLLANYNVYNQTEASSIVAKNMLFLQSGQLKVDAGLYSWNAFQVFMKRKGFLVSREPYNETLEIYNFIQIATANNVDVNAVNTLKAKLDTLYASGNDAWNGALKLYIHDTKEVPTPDNDVLALIFNNYQVSDKYIGNISANLSDSAGNYYTYAYTKAIVNSTCKIKVKIYEKQISNLPYTSDIEIKEKVVANYKEDYSLGKDFEPIYYLNLNDVPSAVAIEMYFSKDGNNYLLDKQAQKLEKSILYNILDVSQIEVERYNV
jgi:hypothetical protein